MQSFQIAFIPLLIMVFSYILSSCTSTHGNYADPNQTEIVGDRWNETDLRLTAQKMVRDMLSSHWISDWQDEQKKKSAKPFLLVDDMENRSSEQIDTSSIFEIVRSDLINSGKIRFLDGGMRDRLLKEYKYQGSGTVRKSQVKGPGKQFGADFFLTGAISDIVGKSDGYKTVTYQIEMRLTNISTSEIVWSGIEKIKKQFKRSRFGF